jgi:hypothetical protein
MEELVIKNEEKKEEKDSDLVRVLMNKGSFELMNRFLEKVNDGNVSGKISKVNGLSWIVSRFVDSAGDSEIKQMRSDHFDELSMLDYILKRSKAEGKVPDEFKALLLKQRISEAAPSKKKNNGLDMIKHQ